MVFRLYVFIFDGSVVMNGFERVLCCYQMEIILKQSVNGLALSSCSQTSGSKRKSLPHS